MLLFQLGESGQTEHNYHKSERLLCECIRYEKLIAWNRWTKVSAKCVLKA